MELRLEIKAANATSSRSNRATVKCIYHRSILILDISCALGRNRD
jgi:hypothetical protein